MLCIALRRLSVCDCADCMLSRACCLVLALRGALLHVLVCQSLTLRQGESRLRAHRLVCFVRCWVCVTRRVRSEQSALCAAAVRWQSAAVCACMRVWSCAARAHRADLGAAVSSVRHAAGQTACMSVRRWRAFSGEERRLREEMGTACKYFCARGLRRCFSGWQGMRVLRLCCEDLLRSRSEALLVWGLRQWLQDRSARGVF